ncbi:chemotaxis protein CheD [Virgibacillus kimchii]
MNEKQAIVKVGIADVKFVKNPGMIRTSGLGSCVGVVVYDANKRVAGMAHIMLPDSSLARQKNKNIYKYADTAIPFLIDHLIKKGASKVRLKAKLAGGAQMFSFSSQSDMMRIGARNTKAIKEILCEYRIPVIAQDVGGNAGRTIEFDTVTNKLKIRKINEKEFFI